MLRKFNNYPTGDNSQPHSTWRKIRRGIVMVTVVLLLMIASYALFTFRAPLLSAYTRISQELQIDLLRFLERKGETHSFFQAAKEFISGAGTSPAPADTSVPEKSTEEFLYTVELTNGGRVEGRTLKTDKESITVTDERGVEVNVARSRVSRVSKRPLP